MSGKQKIFFLSTLLIPAFFLLSAPKASPSLKQKLSLKNVFPGEHFNEPVDMAEFPEKINHRTYFAIAERAGKIILLSTEHPHSKILLLDLTHKICSEGTEEGLLGFAFDPHYSKNNRLYIYYSLCNPLSTNVSRIILHSELEHKKPGFSYTEETILKIPQPFSNHNGGHLEFASDNFLYLGTGDGGSAGDPNNNAQRLDSLLGKILRLDVSPAKGYLIPKDNPFQSAKAPEIYAYGLRNPWRFSIDKKTNLLWVADVGQNHYEEISIIKSGKNYGWRIMEGFHCYNPPKNCSRKNLELPVFEYSHNEGLAIIGGYVYRGRQIPALQNHYIFGDYASGKIWSLDTSLLNNPKAKKITLLFHPSINISSFARDSKGEIYVLDISRGGLYKIVPANGGAN